MENKAIPSSHKTQPLSGSPAANDSPSTTAWFLDRKVRRTSLPIVRGRPTADAPKLKRLMLEQGELSQLCDGERPIHYLAFVELRQGTVRGNHFHKVKYEFFYVISGATLLLLEDPKTEIRDHVPLQTGDLVEIPPGLAHCFRVSVQGHALEFSENRFDAADVYPFALSGP